MVPPQLNPRDQTLLYLRKYQSELLKFMPQLSRGIQLLQEGRANHLNSFLPTFRALNTANDGAIDVVQRYVALHQRIEEHHAQHHHQHPANQQNAGQQNVNQPQPNMPQPPPSIPQPPPNANQNSGPNNSLGGLMAHNSGFNFANIFANMSNRPQEGQSQPQPQQPQPQQANSQQGGSSLP